MFMLIHIAGYLSTFCLNVYNQQEQLLKINLKFVILTFICIEMIRKREIAT